MGVEDKHIGCGVVAVFVTSSRKVKTVPSRKGGDKHLIRAHDETK